MGFLHGRLITEDGIKLLYQDNNFFIIYVCVNIGQV